MRQLAIVAASVAAYALRQELGVGLEVLAVLGAASVLNVIAGVVSRRSTSWLAPLFAVVTWALLAFFTGGVNSPLAAGLWLEIVISALTLPPRGSLWVSAGCIASLWLVQGVLGVSEVLGRMGLATGFLAVLGLVTFAASEQLVRKERARLAESCQQSQRLLHLEQALDDVRVVGEVGERAARMAHSVRNGVHSLRGFIQLIEARGLSPDATQRAMAGIRLAIERLDETSRLALCTPEGEPLTQPSTGACEISHTVAEVIDEARQIHPDIRWVQNVAKTLPAVSLPVTQLREVLTVLVQNAAEASHGVGEVVVEVHPDGTGVRFCVRDDGPGISPLVRHSLFRPRATTKASGTGYGLFTARRLVEARGGYLAAEPSSGRGAAFSLRLPSDAGQTRRLGGK